MGPDIRREEPAMGFLDEAKDKLGDAAEWVKDKAGHLGEQAQGAGHSLGEKAADARHWVGSKVVGETAPDTPLGGQVVPESQSIGDASADAHVGGGGTFDAAPVQGSAATEWVEITGDGATVDASEPSSDAQEEPFAAGGPIVSEPFAEAGPAEPFAEDEPTQDRPV